MSDHGFTSFARGVNVNAWLAREGYLTLKEGAAGGKWLEGVDWGRTRAFALGLAGIYVNVAGRERQGIVPRDGVTALKKEIAEKLKGLRDDARGRVAVRDVYDLGEMYTGPYLDGGPELIVGYDAGYRASWDSATGGTAGDVFEDNVKAWSGDHCVAADLVPGVLFTNARVATENPRIVDIAPTMLELFGVAAPSYMEGRPLELELPPQPEEAEKDVNEKA
jgi:predicted AlkP superfamily phosphohydrolase/phosphomutase